jgi:hypothetical protein
MKVQILVKKRNVNGIELFWSGPLNGAEASTNAVFQLRSANRKGSYIGKGSRMIKIKRANYNPSNWTVTITPNLLFPRSKRVQLLVHGSGSLGLMDSLGRYIAGSGGVSGTDAIAIV